MLAVTGAYVILARQRKYSVMQTNESAPAFGRWRALLWPIHAKELPIFGPLLIIFFLICFNYNVLRALKDALVVTAPTSGAEIIPFLKVWGILPGAFLITLLFTYLSNRFSRETIFYIIMGVFIGFFAVFVGILYPLRGVIHPDVLIDRLSTHLPLGCSGFLAIIRNWSFALFYVMSELWGTTIMTVLFWGFTNEFLSLEKAKRFYMIIMMGGNLASILAGQIVAKFSAFGMNAIFWNHQDAWDSTLTTSCLLVICVGLLTLVFFWWFQKRNVERQTGISKPYKEPDKSASSGNNFSLLTQSRPLLLLALIVVCYNICINLTEVTWKDQLRILYPHPSDFNAYMGRVLIWIGILATFLGIITNALIQRVQWAFIAMIPPLIMLLMGIGFFSFLFLKDANVNAAVAFFGATPLMISIFFGTAQNCFAKASKFSLFDMTKELAFIPLSKETRLKGKAVVDGMGSRIGKSGGSLLYQVLLMSLGSIAGSLPYVAAVFLVAVSIWIYAVNAHGRSAAESSVKT